MPIYYEYNYQFNMGGGAPSIIDIFEAEYLREPMTPGAKVASAEDFYKIYTDLPLEELTEEQYDYHLCVLPPMLWKPVHGLNQFLMAEFEIGPITRQLVTVTDAEGQKYYTKYVNVTDRSTFTTPELIAEFEKDKHQYDNPWTPDQKD